MQQRNVLRLAPALLVAAALGSNGFAQGAAPSIRFSGYVDADFATTFSPGGVSDPRHATGLEVDLTPTVTFSPRLNAVLYTTMNDGIVPAQGAGRTWDDVNFDGVALNWLVDPATTLMVGDLIYGTGYFNYYGNKRSAAVIGEHAVRGVGVARGPLTVTTGVADMGAGPSQTWSTFAKYDIALGPNATLTPSAKVTLGLEDAVPVVGGLSFDGKFGAVGLSLDLAGDYYNGYYDPGFTALFEPSYASGNFSLASAFFYNKKGRNPNNQVSPTAPRTTSAIDAGEGSVLGPKLFDDFFAYVEPGFTLSEYYAIGLPLEYHQPDLDLEGEAGEGIWVVPTFYVYPGSGVQWWLWAGAVIPTAAGLDPTFSAGSEIIFRF